MKTLIRLRQLTFASLVLAVLPAGAQIATWNGSVDANWSTAGNWTPGAPAAGDALVFDGVNQTSPNNDYATNTGFSGISFAPGAAAFTLGGNDINLGGVVQNASVNLQTFALSVGLTNDVTFNTVSNLDTTVGDLTLLAAVSGAGQLFKIGGGTLTVSNKTYTGLTTVSNGLLDVNAGGSYTLAGGSLLLNYRSYYTTPTIAFTADSSVGIALLDNTEPRGLDIAGAVGTAGFKFTKIGQGIWRMGYGGVINAREIVVAEGTLANLGDASIAPTRWGTTNVITVSDSATLRADDGGTCPNPIVLNGGDGTAAGSYTHQGALVGGSRNNTAPTNNIFTGTITLNQSTVIGSIWGKLILAGNVTGPGGLNKTGAQPLILSGTNNYGGDTVVTTGTLQLGSPTALPSGATNGNVALFNSTTLDLNGNNASANGFSDDGATTAILDNTSATPAALAFGNNNQSVAFVGTVRNTGNALSIVKNGSSTATLLGLNTYSGANVVNGGKLEINIPTSVTTNGPISVADGAEFSVHKPVSSAIFKASTLTLGASGATILDIDLGSFGNPSAAVFTITNGTGTFTANGTVTINLAGNGAVMSTGQFPLIKYLVRAGGGNFVLGTLPDSVVATLVTNNVNKSIDLNVSSTPVTTWAGSLTNNNWDINTTKNWKVGTNATVYLEGAGVLFNDTAATNLVNFSTVVTPNATLINAASSYTFDGSGGLAGNSLTKNGSGTLTLLTTNNTYTATLVSGGTLQVGNGGTNGSLSAGAVQVDATLAFNHSDDLTVANVISGIGSVVKLGTNILTLSGAPNAHTGGTIVSNGVLKLGSATALGVPVGNTALATVVSGASLDVNGKTVTSVSPVIVSGSGVAANRGAVFSTVGQGCEIGCAPQGIRILQLAGDAAIGNDGASWSLGGSLGTGALGGLRGNGFSLTKVGTSTLLLSCTNISAPSQFIIGGGGVVFTCPTTLVLGGAPILITNNAWVDVFDNVNNSGFTIPDNITIGTGGGQLRNTRGAYYNQAPVNVFNGSITLNDTLTINNNCYYKGAPNPTVLTLGKMTFNGSVSGSGGIVNNGATNTVTFNGANTYTGATVVNAGIVQLSANQQGGGAYTNVDGAALDVPSQTGNVTLPMSSLAVGSVNGTTLYLTRLTAFSTTTAAITATNLTVIGTNALILPGLAYATPGQFPLIKYSGALNGGGTFVAGGAVRGVPGYISNNVANSSIDLVVPGGSPVVWVGNVNNGWDIGSSLNWQTNGISTDYEQIGVTGDAVTFNDFSSVTNVNVTTAVAPALIVVSNSAKIYGLGGAAITGTASLLKTGNGTLIVSNNNSFTGGTYISGGTLKLGTNGALNNTAGQVTVTPNGVLDFNSTNNNPNGLACTISGAGFSGWGTLVNNFTNALSTTAIGPGSVTLAGSATIGGTNRWDIRSGANTFNTPSNAYTLTKVGAGIVGFSGTAVSSNLGDIYILAGTLAYEGATTRLGNPTNTIYIANGAQLRFNSATIPLNKTIVCSNGAAIGANGGNSATVNVVNGLVKLDSGNVNFNLNFYNGLVFSNVISGAGGFSLQFQSTVTLAGTNTYTGNTVVPRCNAASGGLGTRLFLIGNGSIANSARITLQGLATGQAYAAYLDVLGRVDGTLTLATNQTLQGDNGAFVRGTVVVGAGATLQPGGISTNYQYMSVSNILTLQAGSTNHMDLYKTATLRTNDLIIASSQINYGGTLRLQTNGTASLVVGDTFKLFAAPAATGNFSSIADASGTTWSFNPATGVATVTGLPPTVNTNATNLVTSVSGNNLTLTWPADHTGWRLQTQTNSLTVGLGTNWSDVAGATLTNQVVLPMNAANGSVFYRMVYP